MQGGGGAGTQETGEERGLRMADEGDSEYWVTMTWMNFKLSTLEQI